MEISIPILVVLFFKYLKKYKNGDLRLNNNKYNKII